MLVAAVPSKPERVVVEVGRPRGHGHEPGQGLLPRGRHHQAGRRPLLPGRGGGRAARRGRAAQRAGPLRERDPRRVLLPEARARLAAGLDRGGALRFPSGRTAEEVVPRDAAALAWMANLGCLELHPHPVRAEDLDHPDELRVDLDPVPGVEWAQIRTVARVVREALDEPRPGGLAQDVRLPRHPRQRAHPPALDVHPGAAGRAGPGPRGRAPRAGPRHQQVVEGGAPRRLPRLQPEREGPHGLQRVLGAAPSPTRASPRR